MDASPILRDALGALNRARLEAVMIGNAAAALHGAPVTTIDVDFMFRDTPATCASSSPSPANSAP
jgi:hypothetical protein